MRKKTNVLVIFPDKWYYKIKKKQKTSIIQGLFCTVAIQPLQVQLVIFTVCICIYIYTYKYSVYIVYVLCTFFSFLLFPVFSLNDKSLKSCQSFHFYQRIFIFYTLISHSHTTALMLDSHMGATYDLKGNRLKF